MNLPNTSEFVGNKILSHTPRSRLLQQAIQVATDKVKRRVNFPTYWLRVN